MGLPNVEVIRQRIAQVPDESMRFCLTACYLWAARIIEVVGLIYMSDSRGHRVPKAYGGDIYAEQRTLNNEPCAVFHLRTAKRGGRERLVALPLNEAFEPLTAPLLAYCQDTPKPVLFPFTRQHVWRYVTEHSTFSGLTYPIEAYALGKRGEVKIPYHDKCFKLHALRHLRATELVSAYGFDAFQLATYCGWKLKSATGFGGVFDRYLSLDWQSYIPKLLKQTRS